MKAPAGKSNYVAVATKQYADRGSIIALLEDDLLPTSALAIEFYCPDYDLAYLYAKAQLFDNGFSCKDGGWHLFRWNKLIESWE